MPSCFITGRSRVGVLPAEGRVIEKFYSGLLSLKALIMVFSKHLLSSSPNRCCAHNASGKMDLEKDIIAS